MLSKSSSSHERKEEGRACLSVSSHTCISCMLGNSSTSGPMEEEAEEDEEEDSLPRVRLCISSSKGSGTLLYWPGAEGGKEEEEAPTIMGRV